MTGKRQSAADAAEIAARAEELRIGAWRVDPRSNELLRNGNRARIEPKAMEVLLALAARPGAVVGREELLRGAWAGLVVSDEALTQAVIKLRKALGDESRSPAYIETIPKRGYRLVAPVVRSATVPKEQADAAGASGRNPRPPLGAASGRRRRLYRPLGIAAAILVALVAAFGLQRFPGQGSLGEDIPLPDLGAGGSGLPTISVRPFEAFGETGQLYMSEGIAADLATDLSRLGGLRVIRAPLASDVSGQAPPARYLASGSVQRTQDRIKINVWLLDTTTNHQLWSERFDRPYSDLIALQEDIVRRLVAELPIEVSQAERQRMAHRYTRNLAAYDAFLRAQALLMRRGQVDNLGARELYRQAISLDPAFARAYAGMAMTYGNEHRYGWAEDRTAVLAQALEQADTASQISPDIREVQWVLAYVHSRRLEHPEAIAALKRAIAIDPSYADAYAFMGAVYCYIGQPEKALPLLRYAMRLNPDAGSLYYLALGYAYFFLGDTEQALINLDEAKARNPADLETRVYLAAAYAARGDRSAAAWEAQEIRALQPDFAAPEWLSASPLADAEEKATLVRLLKGYGL